jgi:hypothetical protein
LFRRKLVSNQPRLPYPISFLHGSIKNRRAPFRCLPQFHHTVSEPANERVSLFPTPTIPITETFLFVPNVGTTHAASRCLHPQALRSPTSRGYTTPEPDYSTTSLLTILFYSISAAPTVVITQHLNQITTLHPNSNHFPFSCENILYILQEYSHQNKLKFPPFLNFVKSIGGMVLSPKYFFFDARNN